MIQIIGEVHYSGMSMTLSAICLNLVYLIQVHGRFICSEQQHSLPLALSECIRIFIFLENSAVHLTCQTHLCYKSKNLELGNDFYSSTITHEFSSEDNLVL